MVTRNMSAFSGRERVRFRQDRKAKTVNYDEGQVGQIIFRRSDGEGAFYEYVRVSDNKTGLFLVVTSGEVTLYARRVNIATTSPAYRSDPDDGPYYNYNYSESDEFFVKRADESIATPLIVSGVLDSFRKRAMDYFSDCLTLVAKIDDSVYKKGDVVAVVEAYNACR